MLLYIYILVYIVIDVSLSYFEPHFIFFFHCIFLLFLQVTLLKDTVAKKDEEIGKLRLFKNNINGDKIGTSSPKHSPSSPRRHSIAVSCPSQTLSGGKSSSLIQKAASDLDNSSEYSDKHSESGSELFEQSRGTVVGGDKSFTESRPVAIDGGQNHTEDVELLGFGDEDSEERLSDISDGGLSMGTETDGSINSIVELTLFPETAKQRAESTDK